MSSTPRPWTRGDVTWEGDGNPGVCVDARGQIVAFCTSWGAGDCVPDNPQPHDFANADLIVRAVNAFDALLAVAKAGDTHHHPDDQYAAILGAIMELDSKHPDWRTWE